jgi:hypothetical protein
MKIRKTLIFLATSLFSFLAIVSVTYSADFQGIVTCGNAGQAPCNFNDAMAFLNNGINWIIRASFWIAVITITWAGARILLQPDNSGERTAAKTMFVKTMKGFFFLLCGFLIVKLIVSGLGVNIAEQEDGGTGIFRWLKF